MELILDSIGIICILGLFLFIFWRMHSMKPKHSPSPARQPEVKGKPIKQEIRKIIVEHIRVKGDLILPEDRQIVYIENEYDEAVNNFIIENYEAICSQFRYYGYRFCYLPIVNKDVNDNEIISYYAPYRGSIKKKTVGNDYLLRGMPADERAKIHPSLLYCFAADNRIYYKRAVIDLENDSDNYFKSLLETIVNDIDSNTPRIRYSLSANHAMYDYVQAEYPDMETQQLINEIEARVAKLAQKGISERILQQIVSKPEVVSRMVITRDYRIILPDYNDMEISMTPLVKAIYFLFLRHPEGINFKDLGDYRNELISLYTAIKGSPLDDNMTKSIYRATDPTDNSINEKVARIREAFVTRFDERLAVNYIIQGERGEAKRIPLHREFVKWE